MPHWIFHKVSAVTEDAKDMMALGSAGGSITMLLTDINLIVHIGGGILASIFVVVRLIHYLRNWKTPPGKQVKP